MPLTAEENKRIEQKIARRKQGYRDRYPEIHGKIVDWVHHFIEDDSLYVSVRFTDQTQFTLRFESGIISLPAELDHCGDGDLKLLREYKK